MPEHVFYYLKESDKEIEVLQQRASGASRRMECLVPIRFNRANSFSQRTPKILTPPPLGCQQKSHSSSLLIESPAGKGLASAFTI